MSQSDEEFFRERGFGLRIGFGSQPALVVIDMVKGFTDPAMPLGANLDDEVAATNRVLASAREARIPIFYTGVEYVEQDLKDAGVWARKQKGCATLVAGTPAVELDPRLGRREEEPLIIKKYASAFFGTDLIARLNSRRIDTLIITGCTTSGCVRATAVDALQNGLIPVVVREAVGDRAEAPHRQALFDLEQKYADVVGVDEVLSYLGDL
ncbi:MAG: isochorismatase family protein [Chloroflexi bacterium]|nr:isochorismatase family protein [Chloroflexota bacterium]